MSVKGTLLPILIAMVIASQPASSQDTNPNAVVGAWTAAFEAADVDALGRLYHRSSIWVGTASKEPELGVSAVRDYFTRAFSVLRDPSAKCNLSTTASFNSDTMILAGLCELGGVRQGQPTRASGMFRVTMTLQRSADGWQISSHHLSAQPG